MSRRLPQWRYELRRFMLLVAIAGLTLVVLTLLARISGTHLCAEDICYQTMTGGK